jgi:hypothetical protein
VSFVNINPASVCILRRVICLIALTLSLSGVSGCKKSSGAESVSGKVTFRSQPLASAVVNFYPVTGRAVPASVSNGEYATELAAGEYTVAIDLGTQLPPGFKEGDPIPPPKIVLPPEYTERAKSSLKASVTAGQSEPIDFDLK